MSNLKEKAKKRWNDYFKSKGVVVIGEVGSWDTKTKFICSKEGCEREGSIFLRNHLNKNSNPNLFCRKHVLEESGFTEITGEVISNILKSMQSTLYTPYLGYEKPLWVKCAYCDCAVKTNYHNLRQRQKKGNVPVCEEHKNKNRPRGKECHAWKEVKSSPRKYRDFLPWQNEVFKLYDFTCVISGQRGGKLSAHHLEGRAKREDLCYHVSNGVVITRELHHEFHDVFMGGRLNSCTLEDFKKFFKQKTGKEFFPKKSNLVINEERVAVVKPSFSNARLYSLGRF